MGKKRKNLSQKLVNQEKRVEKAIDKDRKKAKEEKISDILTDLWQNKNDKITKTYPSPRSGATLVSHPTEDILYLFGGEYDNGKEIVFYDELFSYDIIKDEWTCMRHKISPGARSSHQMVAFSHQGGQLWLFGGEYISKSHLQIHHYNDLWLYDITRNVWENIKLNSGPSPRSGHRMVALDKFIVLFGGFFNDNKRCEYFNDLYVFDIENRIWNKIKGLNQKGICPAPRSAFHMLAYTDSNNSKPNEKSIENGILIFWGYAITNETTNGKSNIKDLSNTKSKSQKFASNSNGIGKNYMDMYKLIPDTTFQNWRWHPLKQKMGATMTSEQSSTLYKCGASSLCYGSGRILLFGGVYDQHEIDDRINSQFFNDMFQFDIGTGVWVPFPILKQHRNDPQTFADEQSTIIDNEMSDSIKRSKICNGSSTNNAMCSPLLSNECCQPKIKTSKNKTRQLNCNGDAENDLSKIPPDNYIRPCPRMKSACTVHYKNGSNLMSVFLFGGMLETTKNAPRNDNCPTSEESTSPFSESEDENETSLDTNEDVYKGTKNTPKQAEDDITIIFDDFYRLDLAFNSKSKKGGITERHWVQLNSGSHQNNMSNYYSDSITESNESSDDSLE